MFMPSCASQALTGTFVTLSALQTAFVLVEGLSAVFASQTQQRSLSLLVHIAANVEPSEEM